MLELKDSLLSQTESCSSATGCSLTYLHIPAHCKEYQHTERSRSIREVLEARELQRSLDAQGDREVQQSPKGRQVLSCSLLEDLWLERCVTVSGVEMQL